MPLPTVPAQTGAAPLLAGGTQGAAALRPLTAVVADALEEGAARRCGPLPGGGPRRLAEVVGGVLRGGVLPEHGTGEREALSSLVRMVAQGAADPADPLCAAHLHCPPLAVAAAADLAASALNPSLDSWDQAPAASELEARTCAGLARLVYGERGAAPDALVTTGGTESNQLGLLLARERLGPDVRVVCGDSAHHSVRRAAWLLGLREPLLVPTPGGVLRAEALRGVLGAGRPCGGVLVVATAGTTDTGAIDPLDELADVAAEFGARLHVDAAYGGMLLFSRALRGRLAGLERAHSVTLDLHKLGWQPVAAGLFAVPDGGDLAPLDHRADYLNAGDDSDAGLPDLLGRSLRTTRRPDVLKIAVTLRALGRSGMAALVERTCAVARELAELVADDPALELFGMPELSTVLFRPVGADGEAVASVRRRLLADGRAVLGRARVAAPGGDGPEGTGLGHQGRSSGGDLPSGLWLKATLLNPYARRADLEALLKLVRDAVPSAPPPGPGRPDPYSPPTGGDTGTVTAAAHGAARTSSTGSTGSTGSTSGTSGTDGTADVRGSRKASTGTPGTARRPRS
ncbi:pyridoxal phosphate-dependent decarboxylase family protein [Streptomyces marispadix]|uniref:Aminotransferase class V-fold PLP-dependent enzyme n=1 Tax=Streptomyces marispadix TaxID=2922868 RepID=A0ABS9SU49_9ACTN|nr:pyridoxal-dependent decarboxylase [Streptomyces marispadix]MCH6159703.1 aminotransferase class V-fold PLP-dependent enzyme [Streptomyces marispadix]